MGTAPLSFSSLERRAPLRVGLLIDRWDPARGGAESALHALAHFLAARGHRVEVFAERAGAQPPGALHLVRTRGWTRGARERRLGRALVDAARGEGCEVTLGVRHLESVDVLWLHGGCHRATLAARRRARERPSRGAAYARPRAPRGRHRAFDELERAALGGGARVVVCPSRLVEEELLERYPHAAERLVVVENGVDAERFHPRERDAARAGLRAVCGLAPGASEPPLLGFLARNPELKGLPPLLAALARVRSPYHLFVAGPRHPRAWRRRARAAGVPPERITVRSWIDPLQAAAGADLALLPTWRDTSGLVLLEALACGTPVVTSRFAGAARALPRAAGVVLDDPWDTARFAEVLAQELERLARVDRAAVRAALAGRTEERCLSALEGILRNARDAAATTSSPAR